MLIADEIQSRRKAGPSILDATALAIEWGCAAKTACMALEDRMAAWRVWKFGTNKSVWSTSSRGKGLPSTVIE
jgi:hypothetical protein